MLSSGFQEPIILFRGAPRHPPPICFCLSLLAISQAEPDGELCGGIGKFGAGNGCGRCRMGEQEGLWLFSGHRRPGSINCTGLPRQFSAFLCLITRVAVAYNSVLILSLSSTDIEQLACKLQKPAPSKTFANTQALSAQHRSDPNA